MYAIRSYYAVIRHPDLGARIILPGLAGQPDHGATDVIEQVEPGTLSYNFV